MSPTIFVLIVWAVVQNSGSAAKPALTFLPNYSPIFVGESVTMNCEARLKAKDYNWFHNDTQIFRGEVLKIVRAETRQSGDYQCQTSDGSKSDKVTLNVVDGRLLLQTAPYIHEGDRFRLKCHHNPKMTAKRTKFTKNGALWLDWRANPLYTEGNIQMNVTAAYECTKELIDNSRTTEETARASVSVRDLFTTPNISFVPSIKNLMCNAVVSSYKPLTELHYGFYKNKEIVRAFGPNNAYEVPANQLRAPGDYSCSVRPKFSQVTKTSNNITVSKSPELAQNVARVALCEYALLLISFIFIT